MSKSPLTGVQAAVSNPLPAVNGQYCGIIGDRPSQSAKSPSIWNHLFRTFDLPATYLAFDVDAARVADLVRALRADDAYLGGNVTVPYKIAVMEHLDDIDETARAIGAVNTIARVDGRLVGYNTDGQGALDSVTRTQPGQRDPFMGDVASRRVLMIGAGGAARAIAFVFAAALGPNGRLDITNRGRGAATALAGAVHARHGNTRAVDDADLAGYDLLINASTLGQLGVRRLPDGRATCLEPYSPLAAAEAPAVDPASDDRAFYRRWIGGAGTGIAANQAAALERMAAAPADLAVFDVIFAPLETVLLRHARLSGHRTLNGKGMNIAQAADGFINRVCATLLRSRGLTGDSAHQQIVESISSAW
ncbi:MAG: hypothetical protein M3R55_07720 [Acidobacteriota bacterium]|nr:hypothetical protein [Acidobacteriota bacterium]